MNPILGAQMLMIRPDDAITAPAKTTIRNPSLLQRALAIGPEHVLKKLPLVTAIMPAKHDRYMYNGQLSLLPSAGREKSTSQSAVMICGWGVKAVMAHSTCGQTCGWQVNLCYLSLTSAKLSALIRVDTPYLCSRASNTDVTLETRARGPCSRAPVHTSREHGPCSRLEAFARQCFCRDGGPVFTDIADRAFVSTGRY